MARRPNWHQMIAALPLAHSDDCGHRFRLIATIQSERWRPPDPTLCVNNLETLSPMEFTVEGGVRR